MESIAEAEERESAVRKEAARRYVRSYLPLLGKELDLPVMQVEFDQVLSIRLLQVESKEQPAQ